MNIVQPDLRAQLGNIRKEEFRDYSQANLDDRRGKLNRAYREDDRKFMRFLIPPGRLLCRI